MKSIRLIDLLAALHATTALIFIQTLRMIPEKFLCAHYFLSCISCDQAWEDHEVIYETEDERRMLKKAISI